MKRNVLLLSSLLIFIGFVLPWFTQPDYGREWSGFQLSQVKGSAGALIYLVFIFPISAAIVAYFSYKNDLRNMGLIIAKTTIMVLSLILIYVVMKSLDDSSIHLGAGVFLTLFGGLGYVAERFIDHSKSETQANIENIAEERNSPTRTKDNIKEVDVAEQLEKFHSLKEKGIITEEEFNREKAKILEK